MMKTDLFAYEVPEYLIAQAPVEPRDRSRLMVIDRRSGSIRHLRFYDLVELLTVDDHLVINDTKVIKARLLGTKQATGAKCECFLLKEMEPGSWEVLVKPAKRLHPGDIIRFSDHGDAFLSGEVVTETDRGHRVVRFKSDQPFLSLLDKIGQTPLPPYIKKYLGNSDRYQTVYATSGTSTAAPTAGLHFTDELLGSLRSKGVGISRIRLDIGLDTFLPIDTDEIEAHKIHSEQITVSPEAAEEINSAIRSGKRVIAVGTTVVRALESVASRTVKDWLLKPRSGSTDLYVTPGYEFKIVKAMITNFHLPRSTLIVLTSAFAGRELLLSAYQEAINAEYRLFSFGDAMLII